MNESKLRWVKINKETVPVNGGWYITKRQYNDGSFGEVLQINFDPKYDDSDRFLQHYDKNSDVFYLDEGHEVPDYYEKQLEEMGNQSLIFEMDLREAKIEIQRLKKLLDEVPCRDGAPVYYVEMQTVCPKCGDVAVKVDLRELGKESAPVPCRDGEQNDDVTKCDKILQNVTSRDGVAQEALREIIAVGHDLECIFCGFKDRIATEVLALTTTDGQK